MLRGAGESPPRLWGCPALHPCTPWPSPHLLPGARRHSPPMLGLCLTIPTGTRGQPVAWHSPGTTGSQGRASPRCSPRNSSSVRRFLWVRRKERSPSRPAGDPRETMSKRMGLLKTLRTGGGLGAGPFVPGACFLWEKHQHWEPEPLAQFPTCAMSLRLLSHQGRAWAPGGTPKWGHPRGQGSLPTHGSPVLPASPLPVSPTGAGGCLASSQPDTAAFWAPGCALQQGSAVGSATLQCCG